MKAIQTVMTISLLAVSSFALAEGGADRVFGRMLQSNEKAMAQYAETQGKAVPDVKHYKYGMNLDIAKVVSVTPSSSACGVVPARMTYEDSQGELHTIEYRVQGFGCPHGG
ncbi:DUF2790 domain-containing protein [Pseudomonas aeruginosa]|jgi:hypothetical protein|nr:MULTISPECIES: DUF2790 domain-containing protein [Pseudomonas]RUJ25120.1 DUF2790 domain-containing protein [Pseudomonas aeruginosa]RUJ43158.1 DUF2790 domain-containing protein [Pseudomonas aeruginosa]UCO98123.1 DUF2790 domain-containing protein [Pseudomonas lalkuanensis]WAG78982.1 DUF2790 domain-containing protein [Pseudomonas furukawaii]